VLLAKICIGIFTRNTIQTTLLQSKTVSPSLPSDGRQTSFTNDSKTESHSHAYQPAMEDTILSRPPVPISCNSGHMPKETTTITFRCRDRHFRDAVACDEGGETLFQFGAKGLWSSWSYRRTLRSADDKHILDVRFHNSKMKEWVVEDPQGRELCLIKDGVSKAGKATSMQAQVIAEEVVGGHVVVDIQSSDHAETKTVFQVGEAIVAEMTILENNDLSFLGSKGLERSAWSLRIAGGVDVALVLALAYCRAMVLHAWRR
jgi:hypothetical protein